MAKSGDRKPLAPKYTPERASMMLAEAELFGDSQTCEKWQITRQTLHNYRCRLRDDDELLQLVAIQRLKLKQEGQVKLKDYLQDQLSLASLAYDDFKQRVTMEEAKYSERELTQSIIHRIDDISKVIGLPDVLSVETNVSLGEGVACPRADIVVHHRKAFVTLMEVKSCQRAYGSNWMLYPAIGQILYYFECLIDKFEVPESKVNLCILTDYDADSYFLQALNRVNKRIYFLNVMPILQSQ